MAVSGVPCIEAEEVTHPPREKVTADICENRKDAISHSISQLLVILILERFWWGYAHIEPSKA